MPEVYYNILIDGGTYEGSHDLETALELYDTVEDVCLREYYGHRKSLQVTEGEKEIILKEGKVGKPLLSLRVHYNDGSQKEEALRIFPEDALSYFQEKEPSTIKVDILNSENEVVLEYS